MITYLVTGGAGFIGSNFTLYMLKKYQNIRIINLDLLTYAGNLNNLKLIENDVRYNFIQGNICDQVCVNKIFSEYNVNYVVNFAAESHVDRSIKDPLIFVETNVLGTLNLANTAHIFWKNGKETYESNVKFLQVSTDEVYGSLGEDGFFCESTPIDPHSPYSASKASADLLVKAFYDTYGFPMNITRCSNNYGPFQFPEKLIPLVIARAKQHQKVPIYGDGMQIRDWLYVEDHCKAIDIVLHKGICGQIYNIGGHNERTNICIVNYIIQYIRDNYDSNVGEWLINYVTDRKGHDRRYAVDSRKISNELGWFPDTSFETGLIQTINWYFNHDL